jgi:hypothetical protein
MFDPFLMSGLQAVSNLASYAQGRPGAANLRRLALAEFH